MVFLPKTLYISYILSIYLYGKSFSRVGKIYLLKRVLGGFVPEEVKSGAVDRGNKLKGEMLMLLRKQLVMVGFKVFVFVCWAVT